MLNYLLHLISIAGLFGATALAVRIAFSCAQLTIGQCPNDIFVVVPLMADMAFIFHDIDARVPIIGKNSTLAVF
jgi:hypothetical protein